MDTLEICGENGLLVTENNWNGASRNEECQKEEDVAQKGSSEENVLEGYGDTSTDNNKNELVVDSENTQSKNEYGIEEYSEDGVIILCPETDTNIHEDGVIRMYDNHTKNAMSNSDICDTENSVNCRIKNKTSKEKTRNDSEEEVEEQQRPGRPRRRRKKKNRHHSTAKDIKIEGQLTNDTIPPTVDSNTTSDNDSNITSIGDSNQSTIPLKHDAAIQISQGNASKRDTDRRDNEIPTREYTDIINATASDTDAKRMRKKKHKEDLCIYKSEEGEELTHHRRRQRRKHRDSKKAKGTEIDNNIEDESNTPTVDTQCQLNSQKYPSSINDLMEQNIKTCTIDAQLEKHQNHTNMHNNDGLESRGSDSEEYKPTDEPIDKNAVSSEDSPVKCLRKKKHRKERRPSCSEDEREQSPRRRKRKHRHQNTANDTQATSLSAELTQPQTKDDIHRVNNNENYDSILNNSVQHQPNHSVIHNTQNADTNSEKQSKQRTNEQHRLDIFTVEGSRRNRSTRALSLDNVDKDVTDDQKKRKKKKKVHGLKKTKAAVGVLPPIVPDSEKGSRLYSERKQKKPSASVGGDDNDDKELEPDVKAAAATYPEPLKLCKIIASYPVISFLAVSVVHLAVFGTTAGLVFNGYDVFPLVFDSLPLYIFEDVHLKELTWKRKTQFSGYVYRPVYGANIARGTRSSIKDSVEIIFERPGVNLLDSHHLRWIQRMEDRLYNIPLYQDEFCMLDTYRVCIKPQSILRFFDGTYLDVDPVFLDPSFSNIPEVIYKAYEYNTTRDYLHLFLGRDSVITRNYSSTSITRSVFLMGWPLGLVTMGGRTVYGSMDTLEEFLAHVFRPHIEYIRDEILVDFIDVYYLSKILYEYDLVKQALQDIMLAIGSVAFIFVFMCFQTASIVITTLGVLSIVSSFLLTNLIYRYAFKYIYFGFFHVIAMFLILGIGADDLFVFYDTWRLTGKTAYPSDAHRLSDCYRRAAKTTFVTSVTTMMAFLVSGLSPLLPVRTFGIFAGVLVAINYIWVIIYFPSIIIIHHTKVKPIWNRFYKCLMSICLFKNSSTKENRTKSVVSLNSSENSTRILIDKEFNETTEENEGSTKDKDATKQSGGKQIKHDNDINTSKDSKQDDLNSISLQAGKSLQLTNGDVAMNGDAALNIRESEVHAIRCSLQEQWEQKKRRDFQDRNRVVRFLRNSFFRFMTSRVVKIVVPLLLLGFSIFFVHRATLIEPDTHQLRLFRSDHNYAKATDRHYTAFIRNNEDEYQRVYLVWGLLPADISSCNTKSAVYCHGSPRYDANFNMNSVEAQTAFKGLCERLDNLPDSDVSALHIRRDTISGKPQISCFTQALERYFQAEANNPQYPADFRLEVPVTSGNVSTLMSSNPVIYRYSLPGGFNNYFEIPISFWLTNGYTLSPTPDYFLYNHLLAEKRTSDSHGAYYSSSGLYYGTKLQYLAIEINTTLNLYQLGYNEGLPIFHRWEDLITNINNGFPSPLKGGMQISETLWHWLHVQETLANSAFMGILVGLTSAWPILVLTTCNVVIGTLATVTIGLVTACVVGLIPLVGWKLGVLESINLCMVVGLSVDYVVHLAEAYRMSESDKRSERVRDMLQSIGLSVVSGAITTIGAAIFMLFAQIRFFYQFGVFIITTVGISLVYSLLGYTTFMSLCGPQGNFGSLRAIGSAIVRYCRVNPDKSESRSCLCASPSEILDRIYDRLSYGKGYNERLDKTSRQT